LDVVSARETAVAVEADSYVELGKDWLEGLSLKEERK
jgi:hypothetical protein